MIDIPETMRQLSASAQAIRALVEAASAEQRGWKPAPETWSLKEVLEHLHNEERGDFRRHLQEMFSDPPLAWGTGAPHDHVSAADCAEALTGFLAEREASLAWLEALQAPDWNVTQSMHFGPPPPEGEEMSISAGDVLVSWVAHDYLHLRQVNELLYAWQERSAAPHSLQYAGGW